ncbi:signal transduction protein [Thiohalobacter thiocyanaticus]|uniref:cyclic-guanylate-specific phosphodiesterase n=1 Tax=Thiohalobacter thiocyanaticus TaxID=585455 RepID=A0A1Z4VSM6_9GAMM|nr:EAL domain-containing protein [Thiohalobacter thiocyanaticus]BAZ94641.1 signal transduction protein [Thiohalobacter thiocyanaticus]
MRSRLLLLVLLAVMPAFALIGYSAHLQRQGVEAAVEAQALHIVQAAIHEERQLISSTRQLLMSMAQLPAARPDSDRRQACNEILAMLRRPNPSYLNLGVATPDGNIFCSAQPFDRAVNIADRSYFQRAVRNRGLGIGEYQSGRITGAPVIVFGYPVLDSNGGITAVVFAALGLSWLEDLMSGLELQPGSSLMVMDSGGTILARSADSPFHAGDSISEQPLFEAIGQHTDGTVVTLKDAYGKPTLYAFESLHGDANERIYVSLGIPAQVAFAEVNHYLYRTGSLLALVSLLVFAAAWFGSDILVLRRVNALKDTAGELAGGNLARRTGLTRGSDELGQLAGAFDDMAASLQRSNRALHTLSACNHAVVRATSEAELLRGVCDNIVAFGGHHAAWVAFRDETEPERLHLKSIAMQETDTPADREPLGLLDMQGDNHPLRDVIELGETFICRDTCSDPAMATWAEAARQQSIRAAALLPLQLNHRLIGVMGIYATEKDAFDSHEIALLGEAAEDLVYGVRALRVSAAHEQAHATIAHMAYYDALTELPNHASFDESLHERLEAASATALLLIEVERFHTINETLGFHHGDSLLNDIGARLGQCLPDTAILTRMRGKEFGILLPDNRPESALACARDIITTLEAPFTIEGLSLYVSVTIGISLFPEHGEEAPELIRRAGSAVRQARRAGTHYALYVPEDEARAHRRLSLAGQLRDAIDRDELVLHYQPKIDLRTHRLWGVEALVRWNHPRDGMIPPGEFISLAEDTGLIKPLTDWVLSAAMCQATRWRSRNRPVPISVNLSANNLHDGRLLEKIEQMLNTCDTDVDLIKLELTESALMLNPDKSLNTLRQLHEQGFSLLIDDFGTGYSSLSYLQRMPVSALKIDKSFVQAMLDGCESLTIVRSTIALAHDLGLTVVAEGVESQAMLQQLERLDCDVAQGYYISRPLPADQFDAWLDTSPYQHYGPDTGDA